MRDESYFALEKPIPIGCPISGFDRLKKDEEEPNPEYERHHDLHHEIVYRRSGGQGNGFGSGINRPGKGKTLPDGPKVEMVPRNGPKTEKELDEMQIPQH